MKKSYGLNNYIEGWMAWNCYSALDYYLPCRRQHVKSTRFKTGVHFTLDGLRMYG